MPINPKDTLILTLSEEYIENIDVINLIERLRDDAFRLLSDKKVNLSDCYPEMSHRENKITMRIYKRMNIKNNN